MHLKCSAVVGFAFSAKIYDLKLRLCQAAYIDAELLLLLLHALVFGLNFDLFLTSERSAIEYVVCFVLQHFLKHRGHECWLDVVKLI